MSENHELKSCPFCGGKASNVSGRIVCSSCLASTSIYPTQEEAAQAWNKRNCSISMHLKCIQEYVKRVNAMIIEHD